MAQQWQRANLERHISLMLCSALPSHIETLYIVNMLLLRWTTRLTDMLELLGHQQQARLSVMPRQTPTKKYGLKTDQELPSPLDE